MAMPRIHGISPTEQRIAERVCLDVIGRSADKQRSFAEYIFNNMSGTPLYELLRDTVLNGRFVTRYPIEYIRYTLHESMSIDKAELKEIAGRSIKGKREYIMLLAYALADVYDLEDMKNSDDPRLDPDLALPEVLEDAPEIPEPAHKILVTAGLPTDVILVLRHLIEENSAPFYDALTEEPIDEKMAIRYERALGMVKAYGSRDGVIHFINSFKEPMGALELGQLCEALSIIFKVDRDTIRRDGKVGKVSSQESAELLLSHALTGTPPEAPEEHPEPEKSDEKLENFAQYLATMVYGTWMSQAEAKSVVSDYLRTE